MEYDASLMASHIVLDGFLPAAVGPAKRDKFMPVLKNQIVKELTKKNPAAGFNADSFQVSFVTDPDTNNVAAAFLSFRSIGDAEKAVAALNCWKFTRTVECKAYFWADFDKFAQVPEEFVAPENEETLNLEELKANDFLLDSLARPQFLLKGGADLHCEWYWFGKNKTADLIKKPSARGGDDHVSSWSEVDQIRKKLQPGLPKEMPCWSPQGTYLCTQHQQGIKFFGGKGLQLLSDLTVENLHHFGVSPNETYAVTVNDREYIFWNVLEARKIRTLPGPAIAKGSPNCAYKYNADDSMVGIAKLDVGKESLSFYTSEDMRLISPEAKPYTAKADGLAAFEWSPRDPSIFACTIAGNQHTGWTIEVNRISEDGHIQNISRRNVLQATDVRLLWHPDGTHVAARVSKVKNGETLHDYLVMAVSYKTVATHVVSVKGGRQILRFNWASGKPRFSCILAADNQNPASVAFFKVEQKGCMQIGMLNMDVDSVYWSHKGKEAVTVNKKKSTLDFIVVDNNSVDRVQKDMDHPGVTDVAWDPSGRFVTSYVSTVYEEAIGHPGWRIWSVFGDVLDSSEKYGGRFSHLQWRPLPKTLLSEQDITRIEKDLPKKREQYEAEENAATKKAEEEESKKKNDAIIRYRKIMNDIEAHHQQKGYDQIRAELRASAPAYKRQMARLAKDPQMVTETTEEVLVLSETTVE